MRRHGAFGQGAEQKTDDGPQHRVDSERSKAETPEYGGRELVRHFIDRRQGVLRGGDDDREGYACQDRCVPGPELRRKAARQCHRQGQRYHRDDDHEKEERCP